MEATPSFYSTSSSSSSSLLKISKTTSVNKTSSLPPPTTTTASNNNNNSTTTDILNKFQVRKLSHSFSTSTSATHELLARLWSNVKNPSTLHSFKQGSQMVLNVGYWDFVLGQRFTGTLYLTLPTVFFIDNHAVKEVWIGSTMISSVDRGSVTTSGAPLIVRCKDFRVLQFIVPTDKDRQAIFTSLQNLMKQSTSLENLPCFTFHPSIRTRKDYGWNSFDLRQEYQRMGVPNKDWFYSDLNIQFTLCDTYPAHLFVPTKNNTILNGSSAFRSRNRLPVLTFLHPNGKSALCRCSQPLAGLIAQCREDQELLAKILAANEGSQTLYVIDTRPLVNAMTNRVQGKGWENDKYYKNIVCKFYPIQNIHVMRNSLDKVVRACSDTEQSLKNFLSEIDSSAWLSHVRIVLETSVFIAQKLIEGSSVLVHCSDGWDRTSQTCAIAQLIIDPYYRTIQGFQTLVDKDWLSFGHKLSDRCGHLCTIDPQEVSPVFTQFLDCVWQLTLQFPNEFQFNERYLIALHDAVHNSLYGNFIGNCIKDRLDLRVQERCYSYWSVVLSQIKDYENPFYNPTAIGQLNVNFSLQMIHLWTGLYNNGRESIEASLPDQYAAVLRHNATLRAHKEWLSTHIQRLAKKLGRSVDQELQGLSLSDTSMSLSMRSDSMIQSLTSPSEGKSIPQSPEEDILHHPLMDSSPPSSIVCSSLERSKEENGEDDEDMEITDPLNKAGFDWNDTLSSESSLISKALNHFTADWQPMRLRRSCKKCNRFFDSSRRKIHCSNCGDLYCRLCVKPVKRLSTVNVNNSVSTEDVVATTTTTVAAAAVPFDIVCCDSCLKLHSEFCDFITSVRNSQG